MRILILMPHPPYPARQGAAIRNYQFLRWLAQSHRVSLLCQGEEGAIDPHLRELCAEVVAVEPPRRNLTTRLLDLVGRREPDLVLRSQSPALARQLQTMLSRGPDILLVECMETTWPLAARPGLLNMMTQARIVFDNHNAEYLLQQRAFLSDVRQPRRWPAALYSLLQTLKLRRYERWLLNSVASSIAVSRQDRDALLALGVRKPVAVIPNGVDCAEYRQRAPVRGGNEILFVGTMDYRPNVDAADWFARAILPGIRRLHPDAFFSVVGARPSPKVRELGGLPGVVVHGAVDDVRPYYQRAAVFVVPMRFGGGVRLKVLEAMFVYPSFYEGFGLPVLEAMASGVPLVSTSQGIEGVEAEAGRHYLLADSAEDFVQQVVRLLRDQSSATRMVEEARRLVEMHYDWQVICQTLESALGMEPAIGVGGG